MNCDQFHELRGRREDTHSIAEVKAMADHAKKCPECFAVVLIGMWTSRQQLTDEQFAEVQRKAAEISRRAAADPELATRY